MEETTTPEELRLLLLPARGHRTIGLVPTMGYLHEGHLALIRAARAENDLVVTTIFVNPAQFGPDEDFERYPRDIERDRRLATQAGVDVLFPPSTETMYPHGPDGQVIWVEPGPLAEHLCGASRPGHFRGVATVVAKLFNMVAPDRAYFGQKDAQQAMIITRMTRDLAFPVDVRIVATVREPDGLALSSRNAYLLPDERAQATALHHSLQAARAAIEHGERDAARLEQIVRGVLGRKAPLGRVDYVTVADLERLRPVEGTIGRDAVVAVAAHFGSTRLIDNLVVRITPEGAEFQ